MLTPSLNIVVGFSVAGSLCACGFIICRGCIRNERELVQSLGEFRAVPVTQCQDSCGTRASVAEGGKINPAACGKQPAEFPL